MTSFEVITGLPLTVGGGIGFIDLATSSLILTIDLGTPLALIPAKNGSPNNAYHGSSCLASSGFPPTVDLTIAGAKTVARYF